MKTLVTIPTYNEAQNITPTIEEVRIWLPDADILVVDDGSPDGTAAIVAAHGEEDPHIRLLVRARKSGLGDAYRAAFRHALDIGYDAIIEMDADGSHPASSLPVLLAELDTSAVVVGSRWVAGGQTDGWAAHRELLSRAASQYARRMLEVPIHDVTSGFRAFRADALRAIEVETTSSTGYSFQIETLHRAARCRLTISEIPITFSERIHGTSKMSPRIILEAATQVWRWRAAPYVPTEQTALTR